LNTNTTETYNSYQIQASELEVQGLGKIIIQINAGPLALNHQRDGEPDCYAVNQNDYLSGIYVYDAAAKNLNKSKFWGFVHYLNGTFD